MNSGRSCSTIDLLQFVVWPKDLRLATTTKPDLSVEYVPVSSLVGISQTAIQTKATKHKQERGNEVAKLTKLEQAAVDMLPEIAAATQAGSYVFKSAFDVAYLVENGLVEQNEEIVNEEGEFATRATNEAIIAVTGTEKITKSESTDETKVEEPKPERKVKMSFEIEKGIELPKTTRGGARTSAYPFEALEVGDSFFIPASEKHPEPAKSLASTISGATKRFDVADLDENGVQKTKSTRNPKTGEVKENVPALKHTRVFTIRAGEKDGVVGARVFRTL